MSDTPTLSAPDGSPLQPVQSDSAWKGSDLQPQERNWRLRLGQDEIDELLALGRGEATALKARVAQTLKTLNSGVGFVLLRGFPIEQLSSPETERAYQSFGALFGEAVPQNKQGDLLTHIRDTGEGDAANRLYKTRKRQDFHTDGADVIGLLCLKTARAGGESRLASSHYIFNEMLRRRPDLAASLFSAFPWDKQGEHRDGEQTWFELPICMEINGRLRVFFIPWYIRDSQKSPDAPRLSKTQEEAVALFESLANDRSINLTMEFQPGDLQLLKNSAIVHSREAYEDHAEASQKRHLLRLWLTVRELTDGDEHLRQGF